MTETSERTINAEMIRDTLFTFFVFSPPFPLDHLYETAAAWTVAPMNFPLNPTRICNAGICTTAAMQSYSYFIPING